MALLDNWDLKDENNAVYQAKEKKKSPEDSDSPSLPKYGVSDLGASFGAPNFAFPFKHSRGDLKSYRHAKFIRNTTPEYVDFTCPAKPSIVWYFHDRRSWHDHNRLRWITTQVPRADARWMGQLLAQLTAQQIRDAFRAAGYSPSEIDGFAQVVEKRIAELNRL